MKMVTKMSPGNLQKTKPIMYTQLPSVSSANPLIHVPVSRVKVQVSSTVDIQISISTFNFDYNSCF